MNKLIPLSFFKSILTIVFIGFSILAYGQNKTLGVGTTAPNANAALHVESPTNNQGFIMPRLTTVQRTGMAALLTPADNGLMLYDTDLKTIYIWDGAAWKTTVQVANGVNVTTTGTDPAGKFVVNNVSSGNPALWAETNSNQPLSAPIYGLNTGTGDVAGAFRINNTSSSLPALYSETNGTGAGLRAQNIGTNGPAAALEITNAANTSPALVVNTAGTGNAIQTTGKIQAGGFIGDGSALTNLPPISLPYSSTFNSASNLFEINASGTGAAGKFANTNNLNTSPALLVESNSTTASALKINTAGTGKAIETTGDIQAGKFFGDGSGLTGVSGAFNIPYTNSASNASTLFDLTNTGTGSVAKFKGDVATTSPTLSIETTSDLIGSEG